MNYASLASGNLRRRPLRSLLTIGGVGMAVAAGVSLAGFNLGYREAITRGIERLGFQVMVMAKGCPYEAATMMLKGGTGLLYLPESALEQIRTDPDIRSITPIFIGIAPREAGGFSDESSANVIIAGVEPVSLSEMKPWLRFKTGSGYDGGRWFSGDDAREAVLGFEAAEYEQRKVGDTFLVSITPHGAVDPVPTRLRVVGVLERTGTQDDGTVFLPLRGAQGLFGRPDALTIIGIKLREFSGIRMREFEGRWLKLPEVQVVSLEQVKGTLLSLVGAAQVMIAAVAVIAGIVAIVGVLNSILMSVYERTGEIGIMKAMGARRRQIFALVCLESVLLCVMGGLMGALVAWGATGTVAAAIQRVADLGVGKDLVRVTGSLISASVGAAAIAGMLAALWPAWRAAALRPVDAIREGE